MKQVFKTIKERWKAKIPQFFKWVMGIGAAIATIALAVQTALIEAGANIPEWWTIAYPYLIGVGAGMAAASKFTQQH